MTSRFNFLGKNMFGYILDFLKLEEKLRICDLNTRARRFVKEDKQLKYYICFLKKFNSLKNQISSEQIEHDNSEVLSFDHLDMIINEIKFETYYDKTVHLSTIKYIFFHLFGNKESLDLTVDKSENFVRNFNLFLKSLNEISPMKPRKKLRSIKIKSRHQKHQNRDQDEIPSEKLERLLDSIENSKSIDTLHLEKFKNSLSLSNKLRRTVYNEKISSLTLNNIKFCYDYIKEFSQCLAYNKTLTNLKMNNNNLTDYDVVEIALNLEKNTKIKSLDLSYNFINFRGFEKILEILDYNHGLENISFAHNLIDIEIKENSQLIRIFKSDKIKLKFLDLNANFISNSGVKNLIKILESNTSLEECNIANSKIRLNEESYQSLREVLGNHISLKKLIIEDY